MKMRLLLLLLLIPYIAFTQDQNGKDDEITDTSHLVLIDQIEAIVYAQDVEIITKSDIDRPSLAGGFRTKEEIIFEREVLLDAKKHNLPQDEEAIEAYLSQIQREHNLTPQQLEEIFVTSGYTLQEGREQLQMLQTVNTMIDMKIRSNLIVPRKDVEEYYAHNPVVMEASYTLQRGFVAQSSKISSDKQYKLLVHYAKTGKGYRDQDIAWSSPFTINHADIAENKQFIYTMEPGSVSLPHLVNGGFEIFRLVEKTPESIKSLEDSYREIVEILRRPKYEELMEKYRQQLNQISSVIYL
jgi:hypothetical protein